MASIKLSIHIPPDSNPETTAGLIRLLSRNPKMRFSTPAKLAEYLEHNQVGSRGEIRTTAASMGILHSDSEGIGLSQIGYTLAHLNESIWGDLFHYLMYTGWAPTEPTDFLQSWSYRQCCMRYWREGAVELTPTYLDRQVAEMIGSAPQAFSEYGNFDDVSFGRKSLTGAQKWLAAVNPSVIDGKVFRRRTFCAPEILILALGYVLRDEQPVVDVDILLSHEKREAICQVCLLEPDMFEKTLDWSMSVYPDLIQEGTTAGFYGRFVRLRKLPTFEDIRR